MPVDDLNSRIANFRRSYMDTPKGRDHYQRELSEEREVSEIYASLREKAAKGEDVTDEILKNLLPHANTSGNRQRGAHISTWPCITKDVRSWYEGAGWKKASEWPEAAKWLLEIVEAGSSENWKAWRSLAVLPIQRGFACGFVTPIVHCLKPALPVINSKVVKTFKSVTTLLGGTEEISSWLPEYPESSEKVLKLVSALKAYGIQDLREWDVYCHWNVHKKLGGGTTVSSPPPPPVPPVIHQPPPQSAVIAHPDVDALCSELEEAQWDTQNPTRFEKAVAAAFSEMSCDAEHIGGAGEADVVASGALGEESFTFVIDAKTCQKGSVRHITDYLPLKAHQAEQEADFVIVIAPGFAGGNTQQFAQAQGIGLLTTKALQDLLRQHASFSLTLDDLKAILSVAGLIDPHLASRMQSRCDRLNALKAILRVFETHQRQDESAAGLTHSAVYWILKGEGDKFSEEQIGDAMAFLSNPTVGILRKSGETYALMAHPSSVPKRLDFLVQGLNEK